MTGSSRDNEHVIAFCVRLYTLLLVAYPADFRRAYGPHMAQTFRAYCQELYGCRGARGLIAVWMVALGDLVASALGEWVARVAPRHTQERVPLMALSTPTMPGAPVGPSRRLATLTLDAIVGVVALPALWVLEALALQTLPQDARNFADWVNNILLVAPCLLWLTVLVVLARRGQTPACIVMRRWVDAVGQPVSWGPLGGLSFWLAAAPVLFVTLMLGEGLCLTGQGHIGWPPPFANYGPGIGAACLMVVAIALPPYLHFRRQPARTGLAPH